MATSRVWTSSRPCPALARTKYRQRRKRSRFATERNDWDEEACGVTPRDGEATRPLPTTSNNPAGGSRWRRTGPSTLIVDVFDEQHVISFFSVKQLIDQILGQQNPKSARANPLCLAVFLMAQRIILRIVRRRIEIFLERKSFARIFNPDEYDAARPEIGNLDTPCRIKLPAMLHRVEQHFSARYCHLILVNFGQVQKFANELQQAIGRRYITAHRKTYPRIRPG